MAITFADSRRFVQDMDGCYRLEDVVEWVSNNLDVEDVFGRQVLREWASDNEETY